MSSSLPLFLNPPPPPSPLCHKPYTFLEFKLTPLSLSKSSHTLSNSYICLSSPASSSNFDREEIRWLREEQRWLREEQRWLREEQRWIRERESLLREIADLKLQIQALENRNSVQGGASEVETVSNIGALLQVLKERSRISESGSSASEMVLESKEEEKELVVRVLDEEEKKGKKKRRALRKGSEGDEVRAMQEALQKLGFYSGEEDIEYSSFSSGTERAVKTWQATLGAPDDGIMTAELLERLYTEQIEDVMSKPNSDQTGTTPTVPQKEGANGAAVASVTEIQQKIVKDESVTEVEVSQHRVFLLGENRWEEPSRLVARDKQVIGTKSRGAPTKCLACRGEGRLLCAECDGTGEPNIEPQFLEWIDEGAKCPYCEGCGFTICDVCEGKTII